MPVVGNKFYNDPNIGAAFNNLAGIFAPPSGSDLSGYANAAATKEKASRLAELFAYAKDPGYDQTQADRMGVLAGLYAPTQSYYSVDQGNQTLRRGQDVVANTSIFNNQADNANAITLKMLDPLAADATRIVPPSIADLYKVDQTQRGFNKTAADNAAALERRKAQDEAMLAANTADNSNAVTLKMLDPVAKDATRFVPPGLADLYKTDPQQIGIVSAQPGEINTLPDGRVIKGADKPLTETELKASILQSLPGNEQRAVAIGNTPVESIIGPDGKTPVVKWRADSIDQSPYNKPGTDAKPTNYRTPDGRQGTAVMGPTGKLIDTQTQQELPPGSVTFGTNVQGSLSDTGLSTTSNQTAATSLDAAITYSKDRLGQYRKLLAENPGITGVPGYVRGLAQDLRSGLNEMVQAYGDDAKFSTPQEMQTWLDTLAKQKNYDPNIAIAASMALDMAYVDAKLHDPSGEVNVREMQQYLDKYDGGLAGNTRVLANLQDLEAQIAAREQQVTKLRNPAATTEQPAAEEEWVRGPDGKLMRKP